MFFAQVSGDESNPAGGAELGEVILATSGAVVVTILALVIVLGHRSGRIAWVGRLAAYSERVSGVPGWASLPIAVVGGSLIIAVIGMYWDISLHIDNGRDPGPLANPAHYFILVGLFGIFIAGLLSMALPKERPSPTAVRLGKDWYAPLGGVLMTACSALALSGFPLDDVWHRIFGQDVTLWGPTHLMLIGGAGLATLATAMLAAEGVRANTDLAPAERRPQRFVLLRRSSMVGALLVGFSTFQAEFDFSVPQFRLLYHPVLLMMAASIALVAARLWIGRGGALLAVLGYLGIRGFLALLVGPVLGQTTLHLPLYIVEALCVEGVALLVTVRRPWVLGALSGVAIGTIGLAAEWGWSHVWMTMSWPSSLLPEAVIFGLLAAVSGGLIGAAIGRALAPREVPLEPTPRWSVALGVLGLLVALAYPLPMPNGEKVTAAVSLQEVTGPPERTVQATVKVDPPDAAENADWFNVTAWQGGGSVVDTLEETGPGEFRTTQPIPVHGNWKSTLRLQRGSAVLGLPIFLPEDKAIPVEEIPAEAQFTREFIRDKENLQREQKSDVAGWLTLVAYLAVLVIVVGLLAALALGLQRLDRDRDRELPRRPEHEPERERSPSAAPA